MNNYGMIKLLMDATPTRDEIFAFIKACGGRAIALEYLEYENQEAIAKAEEEATSDKTWQTYAKAGIRIYLGQMRLEKSGERTPSGLNHRDLIQTLIDAWNTSKGPKCEHCGQILRLTFCSDGMVRREEHIKRGDSCSVSGHWPSL